MIGNKNKADIPGMNFKFRPVYSKEYKSRIAYRTQMNLVDEQYGILLPEQYVPISELSNQCKSLAFWQTEAICRLMEGLDDNRLGYDWISMFIPLAAMDKEKLATTLLYIIRENRANPDNFAVELPVDVIERPTAMIMENINLLRESQIKVIIRDYGMAYSNVMDLSNIPADYCIISNSLAAHISGTEVQKKLYSGLVQMVMDAGMQAISDGIDSSRLKEDWEKESINDNCMGNAVGKWFDEDMLKVDRRKVRYF